MRCPNFYVLSRVFCAHVQMMRSEITKYNKRFGVVKAMGRGYVGEELVVEAEITLAMGK